MNEEFLCHSRAFIDCFVSDTQNSLLEKFNLLDTRTPLSLFFASTHEKCLFWFSHSFLRFPYNGIFVMPYTQSLRASVYDLFVLYTAIVVVY